MEVDGVQVVSEEDGEPLDSVTTASVTQVLVPPPVEGAVEVVPLISEPVEVFPAPVIVAEPQVACKLARLGTDITTVDTLDTRSLRSGRIPDSANVMVTLADLCLFSAGPRVQVLAIEAVINAVTPATLIPSQYKDKFEIPASFHAAWNNQREIIKDTIEEQQQFPVEINTIWAQQLTPLIYRRIAQNRRRPQINDIRQFFPVNPPPRRVATLAHVDDTDQTHLSTNSHVHPQD